MSTLTVSNLSAAMMFAVATSITPGPNNAMLLASGVNFGWSRTLPHLLGVSAGLFFILVLGATGLQQWLFQMSWLREAVKWLGASYLVYLAWRLFVADSGGSSPLSSRARPMTLIEAALFQWVNPKVWAMVLGFFSTYVPAQSRMHEALLLCGVFGLVNLPCVGLWAFTGDRLHLWLQTGKRLVVFNRLMAVLLLVSVGMALHQAA